MSQLMAKEIPADIREEVSSMESLLEQALNHSARLGNSATKVSVAGQQGLAVNVRLGEVETLEYTKDRGVSVTVYRGFQSGSASSGDLRAESLADCVARATDIARFTEEDRCNGLPDQARLAGDSPDLDLWHPSDLDAAVAIERALACETAGREVSERITNSEGSSVSLVRGVTVSGNSLGFSGVQYGTRYSQSCVLIAGENDTMQRDFWYDAVRCLGDLETAEETGRKAGRRTLARLGARAVPTTKVPVLFAPQIARGLIGHFIGAISGGALYRKRSFLQDSLGQRLFPAFVNLLERPQLPRGPASAAFDQEGVLTEQRAVVEDGRVNNYVLNSYSARRLGMQTTGNAGGVRNLLLQPGTSDRQALLREMGTGLLVDEVMGQGVNPVTGDYSRGAAGFWVENGEIRFPVQEVTIAGNLKQMYRDIVAVGNDLDLRGNIQCGSILVREMTLAGE